MAEKSPYLNVSDLTGGINDADSPFSIEPNQVTEAKNLDFRAGRIGTKRNGMSPVYLTNSVVGRALPRLGTTNKGGFTAAGSGSITVSAITNSTDATTNANHFLVAWIAVNSTANVTALTLGGVALTQITAVSVAATRRLEAWYLRTPALAGGSLAVTLSFATDCSIVAQRWTEVDAAASPVASTSFAFGASGLPALSLASNQKYMTLGGIAVDPVVVTTNVTPNTRDAQAQTNGFISLDTVAVPGTNPFSWITWSLSGAGASAVILANILGRDDSVTGTLGVTSTVVALIRHTPTNDPMQDELWAIDSWGRMDRYTGAVWIGGVPTVNLTTGPYATVSYHSNGVSLHGKLFLAVYGGTGQPDRLLVWDGTVLRWAGLAPPTAAPTGANTGAGTFSGTRFYRTRYTEQVGGVTVRRSEPSAVLQFAPSGAGTGVIVTISPMPGANDFENQTHWELEASFDNALYYRIATTVVATTTVTDSTAFASAATYVAFPLSENIGEYVVPPNARHVAVDQDRLLMGGSPNTATPLLDSRVSWTPLRADTGVGNDERIPVTARFFRDLDGLSGGNLTHLIPGMMGGIFAFKLSRIYKLTRTGGTPAYNTKYESASRGCFFRAGRLSSGINGAPIVFFVDPNVGLCAFSDQGVEDLMQTRRTVAARMNNTPTVLNARVAVYSRHWLVWVWLSLDGAVIPNYCLAYNLRTRGWTDYTGGFAKVVAAVPCFTTLGEIPYVAVSTPVNSYILEADQTSTDDGVAFRAWITTKPMQLGQLYRKFGIQAVVLHAKVAASTIGLALIRNLGLERKDLTTSIAAVSTETYAIKPLDDARMSECHFIQFELGDPVTYAGAQLQQTWTLDELVAKMRSEDESTS